MTREEIKDYILTKITYDHLTPNYILSKWVTVKDLATVKSLMIEIPHLEIDEENSKFRLKRRI